MKLSNPTNVRVPNPSQLENPRMNANTSGPSMKASSPTSCGDRKNNAQPRVLALLLLHRRGDAHVVD